jgi:hypothetical protein
MFQLLVRKPPAIPVTKWDVLAVPVAGRKTTTIPFFKGKWQCSIYSL